MVILTFCATCGSLQPTGKELEEKPKCDNCDRPLSQPVDRVEGQFTDEGARILQEAYGNPQ